MALCTTAYTSAESCRIQIPVHTHVLRQLRRDNNIKALLCAAGEERSSRQFKHCAAAASC